MKIFVMTTRVPWPLEKGDKLRIYHQLKFLSRDHEVFLCCLSEGEIHPEAAAKLSEICSDFKIFPLSKKGIVARVIYALFDPKPFQVHYFFSRKIRKEVYRLVHSFGPDHIYCQLIRSAEYVKHIHSVPKTIDYMDAFNKGIERLLKVSPWYTKWFWKRESRRLLAYENLIFDYFEHHAIISEQDRRLIFHPRRKEIKVVPNGVDSRYFSPKECEKTHDIVFVGNMSYPPNVNCVERLVKEIMPRVWAKLPHAKVLISGADPAPSVLHLASEGVTVSGWVDDIRNSYASGKIFVAPLEIGTGLQNKLLEAMSMGIPCITSSLANNALGAVDGEEILVRESTEDFAESIVNLLSASSLQNRLSEAGRKFVVEKFSWSSTGQQLEELFLSNSNTGTP